MIKKIFLLCMLTKCVVFAGDFGGNTPSDNQGRFCNMVKRGARVLGKLGVVVAFVAGCGFGSFYLQKFFNGKIIRSNGISDKKKPSEVNSKSKVIKSN